MKKNNVFAMNTATADETKRGALVAAVSAFRLDIVLTIDESAKARLETRIADEKGVLSETKKAALREDLAELAKDIKTEHAELRKVDAIRKTVVSDIMTETGAEKTIVDNLFRVLACFGNPALNKYALRGECTAWTEDLEKAMETAHNLKFSETTGNRENTKATREAYRNARDIIRDRVRASVFVPDNSYFDHISVNLNTSDLGALHESYITGVGIKYKTDKKTGAVSIENDFDVKTRVKKSRGKNAKIDASEFWGVAVDRIITHICK